VVAGLTGPTVLPHGLVWITVAVLVWAAGTILWRTVDWPKHPGRPDPPPQVESAPHSASTTRS
jgi:hypothetical protein